MTRNDFRDFRKRLLTQCAELNDTKGRAYAGEGDDALANFKRNAHRHITPLDVWRIYAGKHWDAITTFVERVHADGFYGAADADPEDIMGRFVDLINYALLGAAMVEEGMTPPRKKQPIPPENLTL